MKDHLFSEKYFILLCILRLMDVRAAKTFPNECTFRTSIKKVASYVNGAGESEMGEAWVDRCKAEAVGSV